MRSHGSLMPPRLFENTGLRISSRRLRLVPSGGQRTSDAGEAQLQVIFERFAEPIGRCIGTASSYMNESGSSAVTGPLSREFDPV